MAISNDEGYISFANNNYATFPPRPLDKKTLKGDHFAIILSLLKMLKEYIKCNMSISLDDIPLHTSQSVISIKERQSLSSDKFLSWDIMNLMLKYYQWYSGIYQSIWITPQFYYYMKESSVTDDVHEKCKCESMGLDTISYSNLKKLIYKQTIVIVHHLSESHWTCTFIFNLMQYINEWEIKNIAKSKSLNPNRVTKHGEDEDDRISGYMYYDPFHLNTDYQEEKEKNIVLESLITLYQYCWNIRKPKEMQSSKTPFDDVNELFEKEDSYFYQFKMENKCVPMQQDNHNCSLAASLAIIRICQALENHDITKEWIDKEERTKQHAIIPLSCFS